MKVDGRWDLRLTADCLTHRAQHQQPRISRQKRQHVGGRFASERGSLFVLGFSGEREHEGKQPPVVGCSRRKLALRVQGCTSTLLETQVSLSVQPWAFACCARCRCRAGVQPGIPRQTSFSSLAAGDGGSLSGLSALMARGLRGKDVGIVGGREAGSDTFVCYWFLGRSSAAVMVSSLRCRDGSNV